VHVLLLEKQNLIKMSNSGFLVIAKKIISESIKSAVFIDDKVLTPYEVDESLFPPKELYQSFLDRDCSLTIYRFIKDDWKTKIRYLLTNRDLVILDWKLNGNEEKYENALLLLENIVNTKSLHFCCIYSDTEEIGLIQEILYSILAFFSNLESKYISKIRVNWDSFIKEHGIEEPEEINNSILYSLIELTIYFKNRAKRKEIFGNLNTVIEKKTDGAISNITEFLKKYRYNLNELIGLGFSINDVLLSDSNKINRYNIKLSSKDIKTLYINNTLIIIKSKKSITDDKFYDAFVNTLTEEHNIFLTLLGLEMRNLFRDGAAFIGKELDGIDELAFFHHYEQLKPKKAFYNLFKDIWKEQSSSFFLEKNPELLDHLDEYKKDNEIDKDLKNFKIENEANQRDLAFLNVFYNKLSIKRKDDEIITFGDIFYYQSGYNIYYFLCVTPHCDCLRPVKIDHQYFFVKGKKVSISTGLKVGDEGFFSFIIDEEVKKPICISWDEYECKPFSIYIPNNKIFASITCKYLGRDIELKYLCCLKENYTQRIANKAFGNPLRVGIYFADFKSKNK